MQITIRKGQGPKQRFNWLDWVNLAADLIADTDLLRIEEALLANKPFRLASVTGSHYDIEREITA